MDDDIKQVVMISIHAPREGGDGKPMPKPWENAISIHAPREGGDLPGFFPVAKGGISIHAPREGGDCSLRH